MEIIDVINRNAIDLQLQVTHKQAALEALTELLWRDGAIRSREEFLADVMLREAEGKTGIGGAIAIPHGKSDSVVRTCIAIGRVDRGIEWETLDGNPVKLIILFAVDNQHRDHLHVKLMAKVAGALADEAVCEALLQAATPQDVLDIFESNA
ncbi:PTS system unknown substrate IIA component (Fru family) [Hydrogenispora ethanolica]|uniref:PTS EIIA type-2 domain-containing protein n=1 Tax=Hydrogenispora ethanolica TaxID=1082276 RepID=A0A4R1SCX2_HYDET|nr:PTS sugar transporter subunit IIA [Hydrogenispora ethanolica]TCL76452.1 PTS system unknown substrate IIA component (Fru family) [Hydrogenispora ethanolica]